MPIQIPQKSLKIMGGGKNGRLSPDLRTVAKYFTWDVDQEKKLLVFAPSTKKKGGLKVWAGRRDVSKSGMISLKSVIKALRLDPEELNGRVYRVNVDGDRLEVQF